MADERINYGLIRRGAGNAVLERIPVPKIRDDKILVRTIAIALNPTDWTTLDAVGEDGTIVGCDFAGIVEEVGKGVTKNFKKGDRISGFSHGANDAEPEYGAFAKYILVKGDLQQHIPDNVSFEAASTVGVAIATVAGGMYRLLGLPFPGTKLDDESSPLFIYGGSTATGTVAIQFAKLSGRKVITTASPKHYALLKSLGADLVFDYHIPNVGEQIREATNGKISQVFDTVSLESTAAISAAALGPNGGKYVSLLPIEEFPRSDVESIFFLGYSQSGESYIFEGEEYPAEPEHYAFAKKFLEVAEKVWAEGKLRPHPQRVGSGGLLGAIEGMQEMRVGNYSGEKLVYRVDETNWPSS